MLITCPKCSVKYKIPSEIKLTEGKKMQCSACQHVFDFHIEPEPKVPEKAVLLPPEDAVLSVKTRTEKITVKMPETKSEQLSSYDKPVLPEVFRPVVNVQKEPSTVPYFWILLCSILLLAFMAMAWLYRDLLENKSLSMPFVSQIQQTRTIKPVPTQKKTEEVPSPVIQKESIKPTEVAVQEEEVPPKNVSVQSVRFRKTPTGDTILIEGVLKNTTSEVLPVPEKVYAMAYNTTGTLSFEKEIYLPSGILYPDMEQPFFGSYTPVSEEIQWVDVVLTK